MTIRHYAGETHRIVADRMGTPTVLGWTNGMAQEEITLFRAYFGVVWVEAVADSRAEALGYGEGLEALSHR